MLPNLVRYFETNQSLKVQHLQVPITEFLWCLPLHQPLTTFFVSFVQYFDSFGSSYFTTWHHSTQTGTIFQNLHLALLKNLLNIFLADLIESKTLLRSIPGKYLTFQLIIRSVDIQTSIECMKNSLIMLLLKIRNFSHIESHLNRS